MHDARKILESDLCAFTPASDPWFASTSLIPCQSACRALPSEYAHLKNSWMEFQATRPRTNHTHEHASTINKNQELGFYSREAVSFESL